MSTKAYVTLIAILAIVLIGCSQATTPETTVETEKEVLADQVALPLTPGNEEPTKRTKTPEPTATTVTDTETPALTGDEIVEACRESLADYSETMGRITWSWAQELSQMIMALPFTAPRIWVEISADDLAEYPTEGFVVLRSEAQSIEAPLCLAEHHQHYLAGMDSLIEMLRDIDDGQPLESEMNPVVHSDHEMAVVFIALSYLREIDSWSLDVLDGVSADAVVAYLPELTFMRQSLGLSPFLMNDYFPGLPEGILVSLDFMPDGRRLVALGEETLSVWDTESGEHILSLANSPASTCSMSEYAISPDGNYLATSGCSGICVWDAASGATIAEISGDPCFNSPTLVFSPDSTRLLVAPQFHGSLTRLYDVETGQMLMVLPESDLLSDEWAFSPTGRQILGLESDSAVVWDAATGDKTMTLGGPKEESLAYLEGPDRAAFGPNGKVIITAGCGDFGADRCDEGFIRIWDADSGAKLYELPGHASEVTSFDFSEDNKVLVTVGEDNTAIVWDLESGQELMTLHHDHIPQGYPLLKVELSSNGEFFLTHSEAAVATTWDLREGELLHTYKGIGAATISPDGNQILMSNLRGQVAVVDAQIGEVVWEMTMPVD